MKEHKQCYWLLDFARECLLFKSKKVVDLLSGMVVWLSIVTLIYLLAVGLFLDNGIDI